MFDKYIDEFIPSAEMKEYLKGQWLSIDKIAKIIYYSPSPINRKKIALTRLLEEFGSEVEKDCIFDTKDYLMTIEEAERLIDVEGVFSNEMCSYDREKGDSDYEFDGLFNKYDDLVQYIKQCIEDYEVSDDTPLLYQAVKWINDESGKLVEACTYWIVRGEIWFVLLNVDVLDGDFPNVHMASNLNLPVPFKPGDILEIDLYPFGDKRIIEMVEIGDNRDCCCLQALSRKHDGTWNMGAVKHGHLGDYLLIEISPLYTLTAYEGELPSEYEVLQDISDYINGSEKKGAVLWKNFHFSSKDEDLTDEGLSALMKKLKAAKT